MFLVNHTETRKLLKYVGGIWNSKAGTGSLVCCWEWHWKSHQPSSVICNLFSHPQAVSMAVRGLGRALPKPNAGPILNCIIILIVLFLSLLLVGSFVAFSCDEVGGWAVSSRIDASWFGRLSNLQLSPIYQVRVWLYYLLECHAMPSSGSKSPGRSHVTQPDSPRHLVWFTYKIRNCF